jgi:hypothetical protein
MVPTPTKVEMENKASGAIGNGLAAVQGKVQPYTIKKYIRHNKRFFVDNLHHKSQLDLYAGDEDNSRKLPGI